MTRRQKDPLRPLTEEERAALERLSRATSEPASHVARARLVLAVADGRSYTAAARGVGRRSGDAVAQLVARFNRAGLAAIAPRHGGGAAVAMARRSGRASWPRRAARPTARRTARRPGRSARCGGRCAAPPMGCRG